MVSISCYLGCLNGQLGGAFSMGGSGGSEAGGSEASGFERVWKLGQW